MAEPPQEPVPAPPDSDSWRRRADEPPRAYAAFVAYREAPPDGRAVSHAAAAMGFDERDCKAWFREHAWPSRVRQWDAEQAEYAGLRSAERRRSTRAMRERHVQEARAVQGKVLERLQSFDPAGMKPETLVRWLKISCDLEERAMGLLDEAAGDDETPHDRHFQERLLQHPQAAEHLIALGELVSGLGRPVRADAAAGWNPGAKPAPTKRRKKPGAD